MIRGFGNSVLYSVSFAMITVLVSICAGYALSDDRLKGKGFFMTLFIITMFFGGGLIPTYLLVKNLGLLDTVWAVIIPGRSMFGTSFSLELSSKEFRMK